MLKAGDIFNAVKALVDDPDGDYTTDERQAPLLQLAQDTLLSRLFDNPNISKFKTRVTLLAIPTGATSLRALGYFDAGKDLELLTDIDEMRERPAGQPDYAFTTVTRQNSLPVQSQDSLNFYYWFTGDDVKFNGATQDTDIQIYGSFSPQPIVSAESAVLPGARTYLEFALAALVARAHGNAQLAADYKQDAMTELATIQNNLIMQQQLIPTRQGAYGEN